MNTVDLLHFDVRKVRKMSIKAPRKNKLKGKSLEEFKESTPTKNEDPKIRSK